jgi:hypothetical protein
MAAATAKTEQLLEVAVSILKPMRKAMCAVEDGGSYLK